jgi:phosphoketolase
MERGRDDRGERVRRAERVAQYRRLHRDADRWAAGYGPIDHSIETQDRVFGLAEDMDRRGILGDGVPLFDVLRAVDRVASAAMWLVVHQTYAQRVHRDGRDLEHADFKVRPDGHTGGALNVVPAYAGYMAANAITGLTRSWLLGQGHTVAAIDSVNLLLGNTSEAHAARYSLSDEGLTRFARDFYSYALGPDGRQDSPLGSHVNAHTAGGLAEGGYLGFAELQYVHMPLPGERLVVFLSDGAFEEQRGSDWAPRWWRAQDSGLVSPIMIANGRRIDQRTTMSQVGGIDWFVDHLRLNGFDPLVFDGRDPAAFAWAVIEMESRLEATARAVRGRDGSYPVPLPYGVAVAPKGAGFVNEGTNLAHNLPLLANPQTDPQAAEDFNEAARRLWVPPVELEAAVATLTHHDATGRPRERDHALADRRPELPLVPPAPPRPLPPDRSDRARWRRSSPMRALDEMFALIVAANPRLRPRVGNPDEMRSNRMLRTLEELRFRVTDPEPDVPESIDGAVITALNEEAVVSAALANKGGINIAVTYEAFGAKMHGALRQEIIFAKHLAEAGRPPGWLSIPIVLTSHTWENGKNEQSHQDPALAEMLLGEASDVSRVLFVPDAAAATEVTRGLYQTRGQIWTLVVPKSEVAEQLAAEEAQQLLEHGAVRIPWAGYRPDRPRLVLTALGAYQLEAALVASERLSARNVEHSVVCMQEPGRFRDPRSDGERALAAPPEVVDALYPAEATARLFIVHTRPEPMLGALRPLDTGAGRTAALGYLNRGGTLDSAGMLFVNGSSWLHVLDAAARLLELPREQLLEAEELAVLDGRATPEPALIDPTRAAAVVG